MMFFLSSKRRHTRGALVTGVQTCALPIFTLISSRERFERDCADLEFVALPGVGHMAQVEVPGRTTKHLLAFAARVTGADVPAPRSEERRVGKECVRPCRSRWSPSH